MTLYRITFVKAAGVCLCFQKRPDRDDVLRGLWATLPKSHPLLKHCESLATSGFFHVRTAGGIVS